MMFSLSSITSVEIGQLEFTEVNSCLSLQEVPEINSEL